MNFSNTLKILKCGSVIPLLILLLSISVGQAIAGEDSLQIAQKITQADKLFLERKSDSAKILYKSVLEQEPRNIKALLGMAKIEYTTTEFEDKDFRASVTSSLDQQSKGIHANQDLIRFSNAYSYLKQIDKNKIDDPEYFYFMGIVLKEMIVVKSVADRNESATTASQCFEKVIKKDSSYKDNLLQYALLLSNRGDYYRSIDLIKRYLKLKPDNADGYLCLDRVIGYIYNEENFRKMEKIFTDGSDIDIYCIASAKRRDKNIYDAITMFQQILNKSPQLIPPVVIYKELLKCYASQENEDAFTSNYTKMLNTLSGEKDFDLVYDDIKYLANRQEILKYYESDLGFKKDKWFASFWSRRTPVGMDARKRIFEHYKRLVYAENTYYKYREIFSFFKPTDSYDSNLEYTDQGFIYIKYGNPDKINKRTQDDNEFMPAGVYYEGWLYLPSAYNDKKIFYFYSLEKKLVSVNYSNAFLDDIRYWDSRINTYLIASQQSLSSYSNIGAGEISLQVDLGDSLAKDMMTNVSQERSEVNLTYKQIKLNYEAYKFRSANNKTELLIAYFLPVPIIFKEIPVKMEKIPVAAGYSFYDSDWNLIIEKNDSTILEKKTDGLRPKVKFVSFDADTGKVNSNIYCNPLGTGVSCFNKDIIEVPGYPKSRLCSSDIMISVIDNKASGNGKKWNKYYLLPSPTNKWSLKKPINLYYEIYNLKKNLEGKTLFRLEYAFRFKGSNENLLTKIFGNNNEVVSTEYSQSGKETESHEYLSFDLNRLTPGTYVMEITVKDMNANKNITLKKEVELF